MMKKFFTSFLVLFSLAGHAQDSSLHYSQRDLKGKVKIVASFTFDAKKQNNDIIKSKDVYGQSITEEYNKAGFVTQYTRDDRSSMFGDEENIYKYNSSNRVIEEEGNYSVIKYKYDASGKRIEAIEYDSEKKIISREKSTYNSRGQLERVVKTDDKGKQLESAEYIYKDGLLIKETLDDFYFFTENTFNYTSGGLLHSKAGLSVQKSNSDTVRTVRTYNAEKQVTGLDYRRRGQRLIAVYDYDRNGNLVKQTTTVYDDYKGGKIIKEHVQNIRYTYDEQGNWTLKVSDPADQGQPYKIEERIISYW